MARVLIVDGDPTYLKALSTSLAMGGHKVKTATTASAGAALLRQDPVDLIVSDLVVDRSLAAAFSALDDLRVAAPATPVIVATAYHETADLDPAEHGMAAVLIKPFALADLQRCIRAVLDHPTGRHLRVKGHDGQAHSTPPLKSDLGPTGSLLSLR